MDNTLRWTVTVEQDPKTGEVILPLPQELLDLKGWEDGTEIEWIIQDNGTYIIQEARNAG
jgi:hypothetical protein